MTERSSELIKREFYMQLSASQDLGLSIEDRNNLSKGVIDSDKVRKDIAGWRQKLEAMNPDTEEDAIKALKKKIDFFDKALFLFAK